MKKQLAATAAAALALTGACAFGGTALADDDNSEKNMDVTYNVASTYTMTIPTEVQLSTTGGGTASIGVLKDDLNLAPDDTVTIAISGLDSSGNATLTHTTKGGVTVTSAVTLDGKSVANNDQVFSLAGRDVSTASLTADLTFGVPAPIGSETILAGSYKGTVTFTAALTQ